MDDELLRIPPPIHTEDPASPPPASILLDSYGYLSCRVNGTTAEGFTRGGESVLVTFWAATHPWFGDLPTALYSEDDLVLLRLPIRRQDDRLHADYFVHQAGTNNNPPSLKLLPPIPRGVSFSDREIVLLRCRDQDTFYFALLHTSLKVWLPCSEGLHEADVVYIMHQPDLDNKDKASVIAVDMRNKTLKDVAYFGSGRPLGYNFTYLQSGVSKHMSN
ncbi:hypothetical protein SETIT_2G432500v2 [Setaria italica]|uniref:DUF1618 domain-containing protein n=1 Tax=Setaria italica TaxID=4555 RepID=A0A368Q9L5_SETIT|nr:hypothetical protein SETIT_2G432500v2 [Setaria italica]